MDRQTLDAAPVADDDMSPLRRGVRRHCDRFQNCDYDAVNALLTLKRTANELQNLSSNYCKQVDLSSGRLNVLMTLNAATDQTMALSEIGDYLIVTRANITGLVDGLVRDGLVERIDHPEDRRMVLARLTDRGRKFMAHFVPQHFKIVNAAMSGLTADEQRALAALLDKLRAHLRSIELPTVTIEI